MRSDARKKLEARRVEVTDLSTLRASLNPADNLNPYLKGFEAGEQFGRDEVIAQLRAIVTRHKPHGTFPAIVAISDLYTLIGDPTTWKPDGAA